MLNSGHPTRAIINLDALTHNMNLLQSHVGNRPLWPAVKANAYGHGAEIVSRHLIQMGYKTLCVAHAFEAAELAEKKIDAVFIVLSPALPESTEYFIHYGFEAVVCTKDQVKSLDEKGRNAGKRISVHLKVDTGMGRVGIKTDEVISFLQYCSNLPNIKVKGLMSHFPKADETDKRFSYQQIEQFNRLKQKTSSYGIDFYHLANSAAVFDLPQSYFDVARPGISIYGLMPSQTMKNSRVNDLRPILTWKSQINFLKEVPEGTGLSYGHDYITGIPSLIGTVPVGYGDGLSRVLSSRMDMLVHGIRCRQVGRICMDQCLIDVTPLRGKVQIGDEVIIIGRWGNEEVTTDELAKKMGTINYEMVTGIAARVSRIAVSEKDEKK